MKVNKNYNPVEIIQTENFLEEIKKNLVPSTLIVTSPGFVKRGVIAKIQDICPDIKIFSDVKPNPELSEIDQAVVGLRKAKVSNIIALGGGSVIDTAKGFALALKTDHENPLRRNLIELDKQKWQDRLPLITIPTTSGTGSEVTPFATIWDSECNKKFSLNTKLLYPDVAILDPSLTQTLTKKITFYTGLDAISHALESLWNINKNSESEKCALYALELINKNFEPLLNDLTNFRYRQSMQLASTFSGYAISHTRTAIAHSISYPMTLAYGMPHGLACSFTLPKILRKYLKIVKSSEEVEILTRTLAFLETVDFEKEIELYTHGDDYKRLKTQMLTANRVGNFIFPVKLVEEYL